VAAVKNIKSAAANENMKSIVAVLLTYYKNIEIIPRKTPYYFRFVDKVK
jgi:hypothetical protein